jgi:hypothetical protein
VPNPQRFDNRNHCVGSRDEIGEVNGRRNDVGDAFEGDGIGLGVGIEDGVAIVELQRLDDLSHTSARPGNYGLGMAYLGSLFLSQLRASDHQEAALCE